MSLIWIILAVALLVVWVITVATEAAERSLREQSRNRPFDSTSPGP